MNNVDPCEYNSVHIPTHRKKGKYAGNKGLPQVITDFGINHEIELINVMKDYYKMMNIDEQ